MTKAYSHTLPASPRISKRPGGPLTPCKPTPAGVQSRSFGSSRGLAIAASPLSHGTTHSVPVCYGRAQRCNAPRCQLVTHRILCRAYAPMPGINLFTLTSAAASGSSARTAVGGVPAASQAIGDSTTRWSVKGMGTTISLWQYSGNRARDVVVQKYTYITISDAYNSILVG